MTNSSISADTRRAEHIEAIFEVCKEKFGQGEIPRAWCFTGVIPKDMPAHTQGQLAVAEWQIGGYTPLWIYFDTYNEANRVADELNKRLGLDMKEATKIVLSSMARPAKSVDSEEVHEEQ